MVDTMITILAQQGFGGLENAAKLLVGCPLDPVGTRGSAECP